MCDNSNQSPFTPKAARLRRALRPVVAHRRVGVLKSATMKRDKICGVYKFTHIPSGKCYVGSSIDCLKRRDSHIKCALSGHRNYFKKSMRELGVENFNFEIIEICEPGKRLLREKFHIASSCSAFPSGFNLVEDPTIGPNYIFSEGVRLKMSLGRLGKPMPESAKEKISKSLIGNTRTLPPS